MRVARKGLMTGQDCFFLLRTLQGMSKACIKPRQVQQFAAYQLVCRIGRQSQALLGAAPVALGTKRHEEPGHCAFRVLLWGDFAWLLLRAIP